MFSRYRQAQSHFRVPGRLQPLTQTLSPSRSQLASLRVYSMGWPPGNISESCDCFVVKASLGFDLVFPRLIECVLLFVHPCRVKLSKSRVRGYGRLGVLRWKSRKRSFALTSSGADETSFVWPLAFSFQYRSRVDQSDDHGYESLVSPSGVPFLHPFL